MKVIPLNIFQIFVSLIALFMILSGSLKFFRRQTGQTAIKFLMTVFIWTGVLIFAIFPDFAKEISKSLGLGENLNTLIFAVFVVIFLILFKILNIIERVEINISQVVREEALKDIKLKEKK